jgi:NADH-quinone oxidoreductase subunit I
MASSHGHDQPTPDADGGVQVLGVTGRHPKARTIVVDRPTAEDASFLRATVAGLGVTVRHFLRNVAPWPFRKYNQIETIQYPEEKFVYPERFRGLHRLMKRDDGAVRCVACMCCPTVCPAHCITIVPAETDDKGVEKYPAIFEIDELRCVVCGLCVEACPCDAIRMDTGEHAKPVEHRDDAVETRESMLARGIRSTAVQGGEGAAWREKKQ